MRSAKAMINRIPITLARINLGAVAKRAHLEGEYFILEKDGIPIAGIMGAAELEDYLEFRDPKVKKEIAASRRDYEAGRVRDVSGFVAELRADRAAKNVPRKARTSARHGRPHIPRRLDARVRAERAQAHSKIAARRGRHRRTRRHSPARPT